MCVGLSTTYSKEFFAKLKIGRKYLMKVKIFQTFQIVKNELLVFLIKTEENGLQVTCLTLLDITILFMFLKSVKWRSGPNNEATQP